MATNEYIFASTTVKRMKETHIQTNSSICFISIPSFWINIWINSFRPILMAVRMIIIILGPGNHFAPPPPSPTTIHCPLGYSGQEPSTVHAPWKQPTSVCPSVVGEKWLGEYKYIKYNWDRYQTLRDSPQSSPVTVAIAPRSRTDWWCTRSLSAPSRRVINWTGSGLIIKLRRCSKDNSANQSFICQNQIYFNCPSVVADAAQQLVHEIHGTMRITGDLSAGNHDINISYSYKRALVNARTEINFRCRFAFP